MREELEGGSIFKLLRGKESRKERERERNANKVGTSFSRLNQDEKFYNIIYLFPDNFSTPSFSLPRLTDSIEETAEAK